MRKKLCEGKRIVSKLKKLLGTGSTLQDKRKAERRNGDRRWMSKVSSPESLPFPDRRKGERRLGERRKG